MATVLWENAKNTMQLLHALTGVKIVATSDRFATVTSFFSSWFLHVIKILQAPQTQLESFGPHNIASLAGMLMGFSPKGLMALISTVLT